MGSEILKRLVLRAREEYPAFVGVVSNEELEAFIVARIPSEQLDESVRVEDLMLACACVKGLRAAHDTLWEIATPDVDRAYARIRPPLTPHEARHVVLDRLLIAPEGGAPRIGAYRGESEIVAFVRSAASRTLLNIANGRPPSESLEDVILRARPVEVPDQDIAYIQRTHQNEVRAAMGMAFPRLAPRERALLRYAIVDQLGVDAIARMFGVPQALATGWVQAAREKYELRVQNHLAERLRVSDRRLVSASRYVSSQIDVTLARTFGA
jgi:RNA polymerase sigma-70 factor